MLLSAMLADGPLRRDIHRVLDFRTKIKMDDYKPRKPIDHRSVFSAALYEMTSEHVSSVCLLLLWSRLSSAPALLRSCVESAVRATWLLLVASEEQVTDVVDGRGRDKGWPGLERLIGAIEAHHKAGGLLRRIFTQTASLNDFSHGGLMQIAQRMAPSIGQPQDNNVHRVCLRNTINALALVTSALHMEAGDMAGVFTVSAASAETFASFESAGDDHSETFL